MYFWVTRPVTSAVPPLSHCLHEGIWFSNYLGKLDAILDFIVPGGS